MELKKLTDELIGLLEDGNTVAAGDLINLLAALKPSALAAGKCDTAGCCSFGQRRGAHCACSTDPESVAFAKLAEACGAAGLAQAKLSKPEPVEPVLCNGCSGSGEGLFEGAACRVCGGVGEVTL